MSYLCWRSERTSNRRKIKIQLSRSLLSCSVGFGIPATIFSRSLTECEIRDCILEINHMISDRFCFNGYVATTRCSCIGRIYRTKVFNVQFDVHHSYALLAHSRKSVLSYFFTVEQEGTL